MKKSFLLKFAAILIFTALLFTGCGNTSGTGGGYDPNPKSGYENDPDKPDDNSGQSKKDGKDDKGDQGTQENNDDNGSVSANNLTDTTWFFEKFKYDDNTCTHEHKTASSNTENSDDSNQTYYLVETYTENKTATIDKEIQTRHYFHVDKDNNVYFGKMQWEESYTKTWVDKIEVYSSGDRYRSVVEGSVNKQVTYTGDKIYDTFAIGKVENMYGNLAFTFTYLNNSDTDYTSSETFKPILRKYLSVYENTAQDKNDYMHYYGFLNDRNYVIPTLNGSTLNLEYESKTEYCSLKTPEDKICNTPINNKSYSVWTKTDLKDEMLDVAKIIKTEDSIKDKEFVKVESEYKMKSDLAFDDSYNYYKYYSFESDEYNRQWLNYWGFDYFYLDDSDFKKAKYAVSLYKDKYYLEINNDGNKDVFEFKEAEEGKEQVFNEFTTISMYDQESFKVYDKIIRKADSIYNSNKFKGNTYQYQKDFIAGKEWYKQAGIWKTEDTTILECTGIEDYRPTGRKGNQNYKLFNSEIEKVVVISADKYLIILKDSSYLLEDKKDKTLEITDSTNSKITITFDNRFGYKADKVVEVVLNFENDKVKFPAFESTDNTYKLPKAMTVAQLGALYAKVANLASNMEAVVSYTDKGEAIQYLKIDDLETKTVYIYSAVRTQASYGAGEEIDEYLTGDEPKLDQPGT